MESNRVVTSQLGETISQVCSSLTIEDTSTVGYRMNFPIAAEFQQNLKAKNRKQVLHPPQEKLTPTQGYFGTNT